MPFFHHRGGLYRSCGSYTTGAFEVSDATAAEWDRVCARAGHGQPRNGNGHRVRPYPAMDVARHAPYAPSGVYADHADEQLAQAAYAMRDRLLRESNGDRQAMLATIAATFGLRHWRDAYNCTRNVGRRNTGEDGRDANGELRWRRWNNRPWSPAATAAVDATASGFRHFGIEIEFDAHDSGPRTNVTRAFATSGLTHVVDWGTYGRRPRHTGWALTYDSTVDPGGEIISDILAGDQASVDEAATVLRIVRDAGGFASHRQGMHVHHDVRDFTTADKVRLVDNVQACQDSLLAFVHPYRRNGSWSAAFTPSRFDLERSYVAAGRNGTGDHTRSAWNFGHLFDTSARFEIRALGWTLNGRDVRAWIRVGQALMTATKAGVTFPPATAVDSMLATLRMHGLSQWAADAFTTKVANRRRQPVTV